jgi:pantothenate kinase
MFLPLATRGTCSFRNRDRPATRESRLTNNLSFTDRGSLLARIRSLAGDRVIVAVAGPPGAGKSTLSASLADALNADHPGSAEVIPMDGFHYDDAILDARMLRSRKGSPPTFDVDGFRHMLARLKSRDEANVAIPVFDRSLDISRAGARIIPASVRILIVEGNYLLLLEPPWIDLRKVFDLTVMIHEPRPLLERRLLSRWRSFGFDKVAARAKVNTNDLPNVDLVLMQSTRAEINVTSSPTDTNSESLGI